MPLWNFDQDVITRHRRTWASVLSYASTRILLPNLKTLSFLVVEPTERHQVSLDWLLLMVSPSLTTFNCYLGNDADQLASMQVAQPVLSRCPFITQLALISHSEAGISAGCLRIMENQDVPQCLEHLTIRIHTVTDQALLWIAQIPQLSSLDLTVVSISSQIIPPGAFGCLTHLAVSGNLDTLVQIWHKYLVLRVTRATITLKVAPSRPSAFSPFFSLVARNSPDINNLDLICLGYINVSVFNDLQPLPLHTLSVRDSTLTATDSNVLWSLAELWPQLQNLDLHRTEIKMSHFLRVTTYLPHLRRLSTMLPDTFFPGEDIDISHLPPISLETQRAVWLAHSFTFSGIRSQLARYEEAELVVFAKSAICLIAIAYF